jgi:hypothetical protein
MLPCIYFCTDVLLQIYNACRKHPLSFESEVDSNLKPKLRQSLFKIIAFHFWKISLVSITDLKIQKLIFQKDSNFDSNIQKLFWFILKISSFKPWFKFEYLNQIPNF